MTPRVSVLMCVYNGERYVADALRSVLQQEYSDFEVVVIDDASTDSGSEVLRDIASGDPRVKLERNAENIGLTRSLNVGLELARGSYVARMDADDLAMPDRFFAQVQFLDEHPEYAVVAGRARFIDSQGNILHTTSAASSDELRARLLFSNPLIHSSVMFRRNVVTELGSYDESLRRAQDYDLWLRCLSHGHELKILDDVSTGYRVHQEQVTNTEPTTMESCRTTAVLRGWKQLAGVELTSQDTDLHHQLYLRQPGLSEIALHSTCDHLRRLRQAFAIRCRTRKTSVAEFDSLVKGMVQALCHAHGERPERYEDYVTGSSRIGFAARGVGQNLYAQYSRTRVRLGRWRRRILGN